MLNLCTAPDTSIDVVGTVPAFAVSAEVLEPSADWAWCLVSTGEGNGWVALWFLEPGTAQVLYLVPRPIICPGIEPFWSFGLLPLSAQYTIPEDCADLEAKE